jgi:hypothetical protein
LIVHPATPHRSTRAQTRQPVVAEVLTNGRLLAQER